MSSKPSFDRLAKTFLFSLFLVSLIVVPRFTLSTARAAGGEIVPNYQDGYQKDETEQAPILTKPESLHLKIKTQPERSAPSAGILPLRPEAWQSWEVIPTLSPTALAIYQRGLGMGNNPHAFSKIGDGEISAAWFLTDFDLGPEFYDLGPYSGLETTIDYFAGSFSRQGAAAHRGFNAQRVLELPLADPDFCQPNETPLDCEIRLNHPSFALISMGTNQVWQPEEFEAGMRQIIETLIEHGVVPVLSTKADNLEGDGRINLTIARLALEYDLPLWNFWSTVQSLPEHGLQKDEEHLTYYPNVFTDSEAMKHAWPVRNLSALQLLEMLRMETQQ
jgi:hypothetical protein